MMQLSFTILFISQKTYVDGTPVINFYILDHTKFEQGIRFVQFDLGLYEIGLNQKIELQFKI